MSDKTELPKEWQQEAENVAEIAGNYLQGAKAMRDAMEKMLKERIEKNETRKENSKKGVERILFTGKINELEQLLNELIFLTPTQDGK